MKITAKNLVIYLVKKHNSLPTFLYPKINKQTYFFLGATYLKAINRQTDYLLPTMIRLQTHTLVHSTPRKRWRASHAAIMIHPIMMPQRVTRRLVGGVPQTPIQFYSSN